MKTKKKEGFDYQNFEQAAVKAMFESKSIEQVLGPFRGYGRGGAALHGGLYRVEIPRAAAPVDIEKALERESVERALKGL